MALGILGVILGLVAIALVLLREHAPGHMIPGFLVGLGIGIAGALVMAWRVLRRPERATTFERAWTQTGDEREDTLLTRALAVVGLASLPLIGIATLAIGFGAEPPMVMTLLMGTLFVTGAGSFAIINHRSWTPPNIHLVRLELLQGSPVAQFGVPRRRSTRLLRCRSHSPSSQSILRRGQ
ncbi:hypothetical protein [Arthrobacter sp. NPDC092385]|uniref:hypothetical protein n=1 Tax=Arthrobacter sp. NPDC092385 TaxID=3363943 RepID=UPI00380B33BA